MSKMFYLFPICAFSIFILIMVTTNSHPKYTNEKDNKMVIYSAKKTNTEFKK